MSVKLILSRVVCRNLCRFSQLKAFLPETRFARRQRAREGSFLAIALNLHEQVSHINITYIKLHKSTEQPSIVAFHLDDFIYLPVINQQE